MHEPVLVLFDRAMIGHDPGEGHPECPDRLRAVEAVVSEFDETRVTLDAPREATAEELARVHHERHVERIFALRDRYGAIDPDTQLSPGSVRAARLAAGAGIGAVDALMKGESRRAFVCARPPGHHAEADRAMGFCLFNNIAVAAAHARVAHGASRVMIVDWDVHHGNGTQHIFFGDPAVLFCSTHQYPFYPGTGGVGEVGSGDGTGMTVNVPLPAGAEDGDFMLAFEEIFEQVAEAYRPEIILVSAGFDAHRDDPLAMMRVSDHGFARMCASVRRMADRHAQGRLALFLEGGYELDALSQGVRSCLQIMSETPEATSAGEAEPLAPGRWEREIRSVRASHRRHWPDLG